MSETSTCPGVGDAIAHTFETMQVSQFNSYLKQPQTVAIIGAGLSGALVATDLLRQATVPLNVGLVERQTSVGRGIAYGNRWNCHLLNVPASKMSAFDDQPNHFLDWLQANAVIEAGTDPFVPRRLYGDYIQSVLEEAIAHAPPQVKLERLVDEAIALKPDSSAGSCPVAVGLASGETVQTNQIVLATGNPSKQLYTLGSPRKAQLWKTTAAREIRQQARLLVTELLKLRGGDVSQ